MLIDTHCHLNDTAFTETLPDVLSRARQAGVTACIVAAYDHASLARTAELAARYPAYIYPAYGLHPWYMPAHLDRAELKGYLLRPGTVAVGEIGLDYSPECPPPDSQLGPLRLQLDLAAETGLPVLIHCRKAHEELLKIIALYKGCVRGVLHSFSGGRDLALRFIELGFSIGFSGSVTRANAKKYHKAAQAIPLERLLLETDAPSIATETTVASQVEPRHTLEVAQSIAELRGMTVAEVAAATTANAQKLFRL
jgi:TatD DNase family protein